MSITFEIVNDNPEITHLRLSGALDMEWTTETSAELRTLVDAGRPVLIDLAGVEIMSSIAMGELVTCHKVVAKKGFSLPQGGLAAQLNRPITGRGQRRDDRVGHLQLI